MRDLHWKQIGRAGTVMTVLVAVSLLASSCGGEKPPDTAAMLYEVQGVIQQLPDPAKPGSELQISHEAIPTFVSSEGKVVGMNAMTMPFPVEQSVSLESLQVGDTVVFTLEVRWDRSPAFQITGLERVESPDPETLEPTEDPGVDVEDESAEDESGEEQHEH